MREIKVYLLLNRNNFEVDILLFHAFPKIKFKSYNL